MKVDIVRALWVAGIAGVAILASCTGDEGATGPAGATGATGATGPAGPAGPAGPSGAEVFRATLTGLNEVPPVTTTATGSMVVTNVGGILTYRVDVGNINNVTLAHIHGAAPAGTNAGVRLNMYVPAQGIGAPPGTTPPSFTTTATLTAGVGTTPNGITTDSLLVLLRNGQAYGNVHTSANGGGEIRGQFTRVP
jgi:hypothetical protein